MNMSLISRLLPLLLAACASAPSLTVPAALEPGADARLALVVAARGVQVYECRSASGREPQWAFVAPEAQLFDAHGRAIGSHGAGPHWVASDGSRLQGTVKARTDAPNHADAIPWLLLATESSGPRGAFSGVTHIQRVSTHGGVAPAGDCDAGSLGRVARIPYTADYRLFRAAAVATSFTSAR